MQKSEIDKQVEVIKRGAVEIISEEELRRKLQTGLKEKRPLRVKAGFDPTSPDIHLGHTVLLRKLRQFQDFGHQVIFLIGDFTARIGDPSGRQEIRKQLTREEVLANAATYKKQVSKILDTDRIEIVFNSEWFEKMPVVEILKLTTHITVSQMLARSDFKKRLSRNQDISLLEFMYPLLQGYDSVKLEADIELGGTDQIFNLLVGRDLQKDFGQPQQVVITMPLLEGTDGKQKMSKSYANFIGINEASQEMFGKLMSISDELMHKYYTLLTDEDLEGVKKIHPKEAKLNLAENITGQYHGSSAAKKAREGFQQVFSEGKLPEDMPVYSLARSSVSVKIIDIILDSGLAASGNEARRLIKDGAVSLDGVRLTEDTIINKEDISKAGKIIKVGKTRFLKIVK